MNNTTNKKVEKTVFCAVLGILLALILICSTAEAEPSYFLQIKQITDNDYEDTMPRIWGNNVVWAGRYEDSDFEILFWDGSTTIPVSNKYGNDLDPRIWGNNVVWHLYDGTDNEIYFWDGSTITKITNNDYHDGNPQVWGNNVVWQGSDGNDLEIYLWDGNSTTKITNNSYDDNAPQICGNNVVWQGSDGSDLEIFFWDGTTTTRITDNSYDDKEPKISGNNVTWYGKPGGIDGAIFFWDGTDITQITYGTDDKYPEISGNNVTWQGSDGNDFEIYFWDGSGITQISDNNDWDIFPRISGNNVVWVGEPNDYYKVFFWDGKTTTQISDNCSSNVYHRISGNNVVWRGATIYDDYEIFFSQMIPLCHIRGMKWHDKNENYVKDLDEQRLGGWRIFADLNENGQFDANEPNAVTDINGQYQLAVATDNRTVMITEEQQNCWQQTYPGGLGAHTFNFKPGEVKEGINFGNAKPTEIHPSAWKQDQHDKLLASDGAANDFFARSVSISGDYAIVAADADDDNGSGSGSAYIFHHDCLAGWIEQDKLTATDGAAVDLFGCSVSISGDYAIVGAYGDDDKGTSSGSAYIFKHDGETWSEQTKLLASDGAAYDIFGRSVSISGNFAIVGAYQDDDNGNYSGSAYIFTTNDVDPNNWDQVTKLTASDAAASDKFGWSVCISGDYAIVGALGDDDKGSSSGSAYIFKRDGETWSEHAKLIAADGAVDDWFGRSVSISGDYAIVGANGDDDNGSYSGSAYIFERDGTSWSEQAKLTASDGAMYDYFGYSVSISGSYAIAGAYSEDGSHFGSSYIFKRSDDITDPNWYEHAKLTASDGATGDDFGYSVSISGSYAIVGAYGDDDNGSLSGSAYVFGKVLCPITDQNGDCFVNFEDLAELANEWLQSVQ